MQVRRLDNKHDMTFGHGRANFSSEAEAVAQRVETRLLLLREEWFLNTDAGVPWLQSIMVKPANLQLAEAEIKGCILETEGVSGVREFKLNYNSETRKIEVFTTVTNIYGSINRIKVSK